MNAFGEEIKKLRLKKNLTLRELADISGLSYSFIGSLERGTFKPSRDSIKQLASSLDASELDLMILAGFIPDNKPEFIDQLRQLEFDINYPKNKKLLAVRSSRSKKMRKMNNLTIEEVEHRCGLQGQYKAFEENKMEFYDFVYHKLAELFNVPVEYLLASEDDEIEIDESDEENNKNPDPLENEKEFISNIELSDDELVKKFTLSVDGEPLSEKEFRRIIAQVRMERKLDQ